jgi:hypothetical protein
MLFRRIMHWLALSITWAVISCESSTAPQDPNIPPPDAVEVDFAQVQSLPGIVVLRGDPLRLVVRDSETWEVLSQGADPPVDFESDFLIVTAMGGRATGGFTIVVERVYRAQQRLLFVKVLETSPGPGCIVTQAATFPVDAVVLPKSAGEVYTFLEHKKVVNCN